MLSAIFAKDGALFTGFVASHANYRTTAAQFAVITEISFPCANVAGPAISTKNGAIFATSAIFTTFHVIALSAIGTSVIVDTVVTHAAIFADKIIIAPMIITAIGTINAVIIRSGSYRCVEKRVK